ncbi:PAS domain-containing protein [Devosia sp.]|uniref:PAS domain-containing protein n=1 Tax=Devosia sp. TaxID=1871048 RepID=UPI001ACBDD7A|nr:PAS domain-containing protein [Devosia sp.]MBN9334507.1 PAS domain-containing protein [Devosia sp.]
MAERGPGIRQSDEWLRAAEARLGIGFWSWDVAVSKLHCSPGLYALAGLNPAGLHLDLAFLETLVHPRDRLAADDPQVFVLDPRQFDRRFRVIRPDGQLHHLRSEARHIFDREGNVTRVVAVVSDVTESLEIQRRLIDQRALLSVVAQLAEAVFWIADEEGRVVDRFGQALEEASNAADDDLINWRLGLHPDDLERLPGLWREAVARRGPHRFAPRLKVGENGYQQFYVEGLPFPANALTEQHFGGFF